MKKYFSYMQKSFFLCLSYRSEVWLRILGNVVIIYIQVSIWSSLIRHAAHYGFTLEDMIAYSIVTTAVTNLLMTNVFRSVDSKLKSGDICMDLQKPVVFPFYLFFYQLGITAFQTLFTTIPSVALAFLFFGFQPPELDKLIPFLFSVLLALLISFLFGYLIALISFWFLTTFALEWTFGALMLIFSGSFLPIWFFTPVWAKIAEALPFQYLGFIPSAIYMGKVAEPYLALGKGALWAIFLLLAVSFLWKKAINRLEVQGG